MIAVHRGDGRVPRRPERARRVPRRVRGWPLPRRISGPGSGASSSSTARCSRCRRCRLAFVFWAISGSGTASPARAAARRASRRARVLDRQRGAGVRGASRWRPASGSATSSWSVAASTSSTTRSRCMGVFLGLLYLDYQLVLVPLFLVPILVARQAFSSYLALKRSHEATVRILVGALEAKDPYTAGHAERVAEYAQYIGLELGIPAEPARAAAARGVDARRRQARRPEPPAEQAGQAHGRGVRRRAQARRRLGRDPHRASTSWHRSRRARRARPRSSRPVADDHGQPIEPHIVAVADAYDAMTSTRSYRRALTQDIAFAELRKNSGRQFHPRVVDALISAAASPRRGARRRPRGLRAPHRRARGSRRFCGPRRSAARRRSREPDGRRDRDELRQPRRGRSRSARSRPRSREPSLRAARRRRSWCSPPQSRSASSSCCGRAIAGRYRCRMRFMLVLIRAFPAPWGLLAIGAGELLAVPLRAGDSRWARGRLGAEHLAAGAAGLARVPRAAPARSSRRDAVDVDVAGGVERRHAARARGVRARSHPPASARRRFRSCADRVGDADGDRIPRRRRSRERGSVGRRPVLGPAPGRVVLVRAARGDQSNLGADDRRALGRAGDGRPLGTRACAAGRGALGAGR